MNVFDRNMPVLHAVMVESGSFRAAACCLFFWFSFAAPLDVPAQEAESVLAEQKTECKTSHNTGDDHASQVGVGKPVGNRDGRVNRVHFAPPLWVVIGASLTAGVIVGIVGIVGAGIAFNVIAFAINFKNRDK